ncbi:pyrroline-5-carboxylate reductase [Massilia sp. Root351]|jgi:pyrroline-5-carboxylate reductase|uniref:pyrroline-5-carboxylate reductase n=1 Tax=Massilia sp. Root351 TaxID=1736522 RepID=UPI00070AB4CE|nr:pyrroline-5-carboxylate reductase [Massilia sp. Root351]KQV91054.1 pyrroline-5-carboxylate reductase [Massilia sp. Root351]
MKIAFIGGGNMAAALISGLAGKLTAGANIHVVDPSAAALEKLRAQFGVSTSAALPGAPHAPDAGVAGGDGAAVAAAAGYQAVASADVIVLAVKPQSMREVAQQLRPLLPLPGGAAAAGPLLVSIAAGIRAADLSRWLGGYGAIVRCMPNTPALIGMGVTGMAASAGVSAQQRAAADAIMKAVGGTVWLDDEDKIDAVTAVSGSGPAYVFYFIEAMQKAAEELGLSAQQGKDLALATFAGAAQLAAQSDEPVSLLRERVTSKGGTTYAALSSMADDGVAEAIGRAMKAAAARGQELGREFGGAD